MRECRKIGVKAVLGTVGMVIFLAAAICGYGIAVWWKKISCWQKITDKK